MKTWLYILTILLALTFISGVVGDNNTQNDIFESLEQGNANDLSFYFNQSITLTIFDDTGLYGKKQAEIILNDFFSAYQIIKVDIIQSKEHVNFTSSICNLHTKDGKLFIVYLTFYKIDNNKVITDLSITQ